MNKTARLEIRLTETHKERWEQARKLGGYPSISALLMESMEDAVNRIFQERLEPLSLGKEGIQRLLEILESPPKEPNDALRKLMQQDFTKIVNNVLLRDAHLKTLKPELKDRTDSKNAQKRTLQQRK
ncbi:DUF1778 domain-containing protein [bacterium]|nr:DUF1778 domain-containing protein [bacterium]